MAKSITKRVGILLAAAMLPGKMLCQLPAVKTTITRSDILIGGQFQLKVKAAVPLNEYTVNWFTLPDSMAHFEVVDAGKLDTTGSGSTATLQQTITLTSFDSGQWVTPAFPVAVKSINGGNTTMLYVDSMPVTVSFMADTSTVLKDIKPIFEVQDKWPLWYYLAGAGVVLLVILLSVLLYRYLSKKRNSAQPGGRLSPYNEAMAALEKLQQPVAGKPETVKAYHVALADILRHYISRKSRVELRNQTTGDLLLYFTGKYPGRELAAQLAAILRESDAVKFAKYLPEAEQSLAAMQQAKNLVSQVEKIQNQQS